MLTKWMLFKVNHQNSDSLIFIDFTGYLLTFLIKCFFKSKEELNKNILINKQNNKICKLLWKLNMRNGDQNKNIYLVDKIY